MNKDAFSQYAKGYHTALKKKVKNPTKSFRKGLEYRKRHMLFCKGVNDVNNGKKAHFTDTDYMNGYMCPRYAGWVKEGPVSWVIPDKVRQQMSRRDGKPYRTGITAFCKKGGQRLVLVGKTQGDKWSLIGGKAKRNEPILLCAQREFEEETKHLFHDHASKLSLVDCADYDKQHTLFLLSVPPLQVDQFAKIVGNINEQEFKELRWMEWDLLRCKRADALEHVSGDLSFWDNRRKDSMKVVSVLKHLVGK